MGRDGGSSLRSQRIFELVVQVVVGRIGGRPTGEAEITWPQLLGLRFLRRHEGCTTGALASGLGISQPAATKLVERLEVRGLVLRARRRDDRRKTLIRLRPRGRRLGQQMLRRRAQQLSGIVSRLDPGVPQSLLGGLEQFLAAALPDARAAQEICLRCGPQHDPDCIVNRAHLAACGKPVVP